MVCRQSKKFIFFILAFFLNSLFGNMGPQGFNEFRSRVFVETGTFSGDGIQKALDAGFEIVYSIDIDEQFVKHAQNRFVSSSSVFVYQKDSSFQLSDLLEEIQEPVVFWLDAHNGFPDPNAVGVENTPLIRELDQIKNHHIKTHTILIDDLHCCGTLLFDYLSLDQIICKVLEINPNYFISFVDGGDEGEYKNNVLVATPFFR